MKRNNLNKLIINSVLLITFSFTFNKSVNIKSNYIDLYQYKINNFLKMPMLGDLKEGDRQIYKNLFFQNIFYENDNSLEFNKENKDKFDLLNKELGHGGLECFLQNIYLFFNKEEITLKYSYTKEIPINLNSTKWLNDSNFHGFKPKYYKKESTFFTEISFLNEERERDYLYLFKPEHLYLFNKDINFIKAINDKINIINKNAFYIPYRYKPSIMRCSAIINSYNKAISQSMDPENIYFRN